MSKTLEEIVAKTYLEEGKKEYYDKTIALGMDDLKLVNAICAAIRKAKCVTEHYFPGYGKSDKCLHCGQPAPEVKE